MDLAPSLGSNYPTHRYSVRFGPGPERALGLARVWTAVGIFLLVFLRPPSVNFPFNQAALCASAFVFYSFVFFLLLREPRKWPNRTRLWLHAGDVTWAAIFALIIPEPRVFMLAFLFALTAAALRWSPSRLLETSGAIALLVSLGWLVEYALPGADPRNAFHPLSASYIFWGLFALFAGGLIWFLARREAAQRWEAASDAAQRAHSRVSVELHDGIVQSLFTIECYIERIRSNIDDLSPDVSEDLESLQDLVHKTSVKLRDIVWQERPLDLGSKSFVEYVNALVAEFEQDTGIAVRFTWDCGEISPPPSGASELIRIIQEALLNIRKHSGARNVSINCGVTRNRLRFRIDDDGQGFDFSGRLGMVELESTAQGPFVIRERVSALGGELAVESKPGRGARLEIALPKDAFV
jgi:signal transduction histidine kinase